MLKTNAYICFAAIFLLSFVGAAPADANQESLKAREGQVRCGGNHFLRVNNTEEHTTNYTLANVDPTEPIIINELRVYNATGAIIYDSVVSGLPASLNGLIGPLNNTLFPNQSVVITTDTFLPYLAQDVRPIQLVIAWSSARRVLPLNVGASLKARERNSTTGAIGAERMRSGVGCESTLRNRD
jgi:hypothetical protein